MKYTTKARLIQLMLPIGVIGSFMLVGYHATHSLFAQSLSPQGVGITTDQTQYTAKEPVTVLLYNTSRFTVYISNNCPNEPLMVYRQVHNAWQQLHAGVSDKKCVGEPREYAIPSGRTVPIDYSYWETLFSQPGVYRIVAPLTSYADGPSTIFRVIQ